MKLDSASNDNKKSIVPREEKELAINYLEEMKENYIEGEGYERHPLPEYYAIETAIKTLNADSIIDKIKAALNSSNKESCNYFAIVYDIEEIINDYEKEREDKEEIEKEEEDYEY